MKRDDEDEDGDVDNMSDPALKTSQMPHQREVYEAHWADEYFALFWEMGLGKTKELLDVAARLWIERKIDALLVVAPKAVYQNWLSTEAPIHLGVPYVGTAHHTEGASSDYARLRRAYTLDPDQWTDKLRVVCCSYSGMKTEIGYEFLSMLVKIHRTMMVLDESTAIKSRKTDTAKIAKKLGAHCHRRWIATGTPVAQSPFDVHSQMEFLDPEFWRRHGLKSVEAFRQMFGEFSIRTVGRGKKFNELQRYRNLDKLGEMLRPASSRLLKEDSDIELPPKIYSVRRFPLHEKQRRAYDALTKTFVAELDGGMYLEASQAVTRAIRLQQITSGHVTAEEFLDLPEDEALDGQETLPFGYEDAGAAVEELPRTMPQIRPLLSSKRVVDVIPPDENPRLELLLQTLSEMPEHKRAIVWCRFRRDVEIVGAALGERAVTYDGGVRQADREERLRLFKDERSHVRYLVANVHAISQGVTLTIAKTAIYYSNSFSLERRLQSEDRPHRIGQDESVHVIDLIAEDTIDEHVVRTLREKFDVAAQVTGDRLREWITVRGAG